MSYLLFAKLSAVLKVSEVRERRGEGKRDPVVEDPSFGWMGLVASVLLLLAGR